MSRKANFFPLGLGYIVKILKNEGYAVSVLDAWANQLSIEDTFKGIKARDFDVIGITALSTQYNFVKALSHSIKNTYPEKKIILGGALATLSAKTVLENTDIDICVIGEGEETIKELLRKLDGSKSVSGISYKEEGNIVDNPLRKYIEDLDSIPFPEYEAFPLDIYFDNSFVAGARRRIKAVTIISGRGCPYNCNYCSKTFSGLRLRSVDNIIDEIKYLKDKYKINGVFFADELLVIGKNRVHELCDKIGPLGLIWNCQARVNTVDYDLLRYMRGAGCVAVGYGIESGSQKILDRMNKAATVEQAREAVSCTVRAGLIPVLQAMFGYPGEDMCSLKETVEFFKSIDHPGVRLSPTTPLPGTRLFREALEKGVIESEKKLLESLDGGYMQNINKLLVNFTDFPNKDFFRIRDKAENTIKMNYYKKHPLSFLSKVFRSGIDNIKENGIKETIKKAVVLFRTQEN